MAGGIFLFSAVDVQAKFLTDTFHPIQIVWSRQLGLLIGMFVLLALRGFVIFCAAYPGLQIARGTLAADSASIFIFAISFVPLADAVAVSFVVPFIVTVLGAFILREPVGVRRWTAVNAGFLGTMIVIRPGLGVIHPAVMLVVVAAILFALRQIVSRVLSNSDRTVTTVAYSALVGRVILTVPLPFVWKWPATTIDLMLLIDIAILAALAELLVIKAPEVAQAVVVAPLQYTLLLWGAMYGYLVFAQMPDLWTWAGALIIVITGLYTLHREWVVARSRSVE